MKFQRIMYCLFFLFFYLWSFGVKAESFSIKKKEIDLIGEKIFINECAGKIENLTSWNIGTDFASLGIGHFIWYPSGKEGPFDEKFPDFLLFLEHRGIELPTWLKDPSKRECPWKSRKEFIQNLQGPTMKSIRKLLANTIPSQAEFMVERLQTVLPKILESTSNPYHIKRQFFRVAKSPMGLYALTDYVNFKGEGILRSERYNGEGWGLLQVLELMPRSSNSNEPMQEFVTCAVRVLTRRVENAPKERFWLPGWKNRLQTYISGL